MDFALSRAAEDACGRMWDFMRDCVLPAEPVYEQWRAAHGEQQQRRAQTLASALQQITGNLSHRLERIAGARRYFLFHQAQVAANQIENFFGRSDGDGSGVVSRLCR